MMFTVTGLNAIGAVLLDCSTVVDAMKEALDLLRSGYVDVLIAVLVTATVTVWSVERAPMRAYGAIERQGAGF
jgi:3-oxoacyl-(acyl-carrier-protein) synthase